MFPPKLAIYFDQLAFAEFGFGYTGVFGTSHVLTHFRTESAGVADDKLEFAIVSIFRLLQQCFHIQFFDQQPNMSPEPTAVGAVSSAVAVHAASRRWLSFFR